MVSYPQAIVTLLFKAQKVALQTFGREPDQVVTPLSHQQLEWLKIIAVIGPFFSLLPRVILITITHPIIWSPFEDASFDFSKYYSLSAYFQGGNGFHR